MAAAVGEGVETPTSPFAPDNPWGMPEDQNGYPEHDVDQAKAEVEAYKTETGESSLHFTLTSAADVDTTRIAQLVQSQWQEAGIDVQHRGGRGLGAASAEVVSGNYEAAILQIYNAPDPDQNHYFWSAATIGGYGGININLTQFTNAADGGRPHDRSGEREHRHPQGRLRRGRRPDQRHGDRTSGSTGTPSRSSPTKDVHGLDGARAVPFTYSNPKTWFGELWRG